jgi:hypothetical protein
MIYECPPVLHRPLPIPSFDEYIALHMALNTALASQPGAAKALRGARRHWVRRVSRLPPA